MKTPKFWTFGVLVTLVLAGGVALYASSSPDGLESVMLEGCETGADGEITGGECVAEAAGEHEIGGPLADYGASFVDGEALSGSTAGIVGVLLVLAAATGLFRLLARRKTAPARGEDA